MSDQTSIGPEPDRDRVRALAQRFQPDSSWIELAARLRDIKSTALFRAWGFNSFRAYHVDELELEKTAVYDLMRAWTFVSRRWPELTAIPSDGKRTPSYNDVVLLARAEGRVADFDQLAEGVRAGTLNREALRSTIRGGAAQRTYVTTLDLREVLRERDLRIQELEAELQEARQQLRSHLGIPQGLDLRRLRAKLARITHPDHGGDEDLMKEVNMLFEALMPRRRAHS